MYIPVAIARAQKKWYFIDSLIDDTGFSDFVFKRVG